MKNTVKLIFGMFAFLVAFNFISCKDPENSGENIPNVTLPGTPGSSSNPNDIFAGKSFTEEYQGKYDFHDNGTVDYSIVVSETEILKLQEFRYSIGDNKLYFALNKITFGKGEDEGATYSESIKIINSYDTKHYKDGLISWFNTTNQKKQGFDTTTDEGLFDCLKFEFSSYGIFLPENITFDKALEQYRAFRNEYDKKSINSVFSSILKHSYKQNEDGTITISVEDSSSFLDILLLSSFSFYLGSFEYDSEDFKFDQWGISGGNVTLKDSSGKELKGKIYDTDSNKIYGVFKEADAEATAPYTKKIEFPYTTEGTGKNTKVKITYNNTQYTLEFNSADLPICPVKAE
ncbi:hypothetical protein [Treponema berlinense]|uniref:hypothetical protein n=1 Tax=Treponema berlinense TaxID=225004 RepID=UPI0026F02FC7|nr:hypothetical protein [Treponema berlinense]